MSIRRLASETAIYGLSSILGRGLYFLLTPLYTGFFTPFELGIPATVFAVIGFLMVLSTLRLDVAYFRQYKTHTDERMLFGTAWLTTASIGGILGTLLLVGSPWLASFFAFPAYQAVFALGGGILLFDSLVELPLARLRMQQRPWRFAGVRTIGILVNLALNVFWLVILPKWPDAPSWLSADAAGIAYIFLANLISSAVVFLMLTPELRGIWRGGLRFDAPLLREMLRFSTPLVIVGFSYIVNEMLDRILLPQVWPGGELEGLELAGVYAQNYKLAMLLALFTQAFRYGAEPYFFRESGRIDAADRYAKLARYYLIAALIGCMLVAMALPVLSQAFLRQPSFRMGSEVVLILLAANLCLGMYYNFSVWYKVTDNTRFGAYISVGGAVLTIVLNLMLIPRYGFFGCAWATLACYFSMMISAWYLGRKRYAIPYAFRQMWMYTGLSMLAILAFYQLSPKLSLPVIELAVNGGSTVQWLLTLGLATVLLAVATLMIILLERAFMRKSMV